MSVKECSVLSTLTGRREQICCSWKNVVAGGELLGFFDSFLFLENNINVTKRFSRRSCVQKRVCTQCFPRLEWVEWVKNIKIESRKKKLNETKTKNFFTAARHSRRRWRHYEHGKLARASSVLKILNIISLRRTANVDWHFSEKKGSRTFAANSTTLHSATLQEWKYKHLHSTHHRVGEEKINWKKMHFREFFFIFSTVPLSSSPTYTVVWRA